MVAEHFIYLSFNISVGLKEQGLKQESLANQELMLINGDD
jgi:hypothetical protein